MRSSLPLHTGWLPKRCRQTPTLRRAARHDFCDLPLGKRLRLLERWHIDLYHVILNGLSVARIFPNRLEGMDRLTKGQVHPGVVAVAEPTSMTWLPLAIALQRAEAGWPWSATVMPPASVAPCPAKTSPTSSTARCCPGPRSSSSSLPWPCARRCAAEHASLCGHPARALHPLIHTFSDRAGEDDACSPAPTGGCRVGVDPRLGIAQ